MIFAVTTTTAQKLKLFNLPVKSVFFTYGSDEDLLNGMDSDYFRAMAKEPNAYLDNLDFENAQIYSAICENPNMELGLTLQLPRKLDFSLAASAVFNRVDAISYDWRYFDSYDYDYLNLSTYSDEFALDFSVNQRVELALWRNKLGNAPFNLYLGLGANMGYISYNEMYVYGAVDYTVDDFSYRQYSELNDEVMDNPEYEYYNEYVELKNGITKRVYGQAGFGITLLRRFEVGMRGRYGYGYRAFRGAGLKTTNLKSLGIFARYLVF